MIESLFRADRFKSEFPPDINFQFVVVFCLGDLCERDHRVHTRDVLSVLFCDVFQCRFGFGILADVFVRLADVVACGHRVIGIGPIINDAAKPVVDRCVLLSQVDLADAPSQQRVRRRVATFVKRKVFVVFGGRDLPVFFAIVLFCDLNLMPLDFA